MKTIAIANQKGGTGKTTTTYNLGIALTQQGYRVLMVDFDPQGNLSCYCGIPPEKDLDQTITELLMKTSCEKPIENRECVYQTGRKEAAARVDFIPSNLRLAGFELAMSTMMCREVLLKSCLEQYNNQYDYCLIDCSPSVGLLLTNALAAANEIIIPMQAQPFSVVGMSQLTSSIANVQRKINPGLRVKGIMFWWGTMQALKSRLPMCLSPRCLWRIWSVRPPIPQSWAATLPAIWSACKTLLLPCRRRSAVCATIYSSCASSWTALKRSCSSPFCRNRN